MTSIPKIVLLNIFANVFAVLTVITMSPLTLPSTPRPGQYPEWERWNLSCSGNQPGMSLEKNITQHNQQSPTGTASLSSNLANPLTLPKFTPNEKSEKNVHDDIVLHHELPHGPSQRKRAGAAGTQRSIHQRVSPYFQHLKEHIRQEKSNSATELSDTDVRYLQKKWLCENAFQNGHLTIKNGVATHEFVTFDDLDRHNPRHFEAISEVQGGHLPTLKHFYQIFSVLCHLNDKVSDPDKVCMPRHSRIDAIRAELLKPGSTTAPDGYANDNTASWTHEVKYNYKIVSRDPNSPQYNWVAKINKEKNKVGPESISPQYALESAYKIIAQSHIQRVEKDGKFEIKHLSRDSTQKAIRGDNKTKLYDSIPTQIIKDFVAACPGCKDDRKREARKLGAETTKAKGGNRGQKNRTNSPKKRRAESDSESDSYTPSKKRATTIPRHPVDTNQYPSGSLPGWTPPFQMNGLFNDACNMFGQQPLQQQQPAEMEYYHAGILPGYSTPTQNNSPNDGFPWKPLEQRQLQMSSRVATQYSNPSQNTTLGSGFQSHPNRSVGRNQFDFPQDPVFADHQPNYQQQNNNDNQSAIIDPGLFDGYVDLRNHDNVLLPSMDGEEKHDNTPTKMPHSITLDATLKRAYEERSVHEESTEQQSPREPTPDYLSTALESTSSYGHNPDHYLLFGNQFDDPMI